MTCNDGRRVLAIAILRGRMGMILLHGQDLCDWRSSKVAYQSPDDAVRALRVWVKRCDPGIVISQNPDAPGRKGKRAIAIMQALARAMSDAEYMDILVPRTRRFDNIHEEAAVLTKRFPELAGKYRDKPPIWKTTPRSMIYFEALAMALQVLEE